jgi:hypothetical protein
MVAKYLREQGFAAADRRLREGRADDQGDIDGVPHTTIQVKYVAQPRLQTWIEDTLKQRDNAGNPFCLLVVRVKGKPVAQWSAYMPREPRPYDPEETPESEAWTWIRMDLRLAVVQLSDMIRTWAYSDLYSLATGSTPTLVGIRTWLSAPSMGNGSRPSATA